MTDNGCACRRSAPPAPLRAGLSSLLAATASLTLFALLTLCLSLVACSAFERETPAPSASPTRGPTAALETPPAPDATPTPTPPNTNAELSIWVPPEFGLDTSGAVTTTVLRDFEAAHPELKVSLSVKQASGKGGLLDLLTGANRVAPDFVPDLVLLTAGDLSAAARQGFLQDLQPLLPADFAEDLLPAVAGMGVRSGIRYGVPFGLDLVHVAYRAAITHRVPVTWGLVSEIGGNYVFGLGGRAGAFEDSLLLQYLGAGGKLTNDQGELAIDARAMEQALGVYKTMVDQRVILSTVVTIDSPDEAWTQFRTAGARFVEVRASKFLAEGQQLSGIAFASVPTLRGRPAALAHAWLWAVSARTPERQQAAAQFLQWVLAPERGLAWCQQAHCLPAAEAAWQGTLSDYQRFLLSLLQVATPFPPALDSTEAATALHNALVGVLTGDRSPATAAQDVAAALRALPR